MFSGCYNCSLVDLILEFVGYCLVCLFGLGGLLLCEFRLGLLLAFVCACVLFGLLVWFLV